MPMRRGQTVQPVIYGAAARRVLQRHADENPEIHDLIVEAGEGMLDLEGVGLRDSTSTYDVSFVMNKAFATFVTPSYEGSANRRNREDGVLSIQVHGLVDEQIAETEEDLSAWSSNRDLRVVKVRNLGDVGSALRVASVAYDWAAGG